MKRKHKKRLKWYTKYTAIMEISELQKYFQKKVNWYKRRGI